MNWKNQRENAYPSIILSDCFVDKIQITNKELILKFLTCGFIIQENSRYYHIKSAQVIFEQCDIEHISIQVVYNKKRLFRHKRIILLWAVCLLGRSERQKQPCGAVSKCSLKI